MDCLRAPARLGVLLAALAAPAAAQMSEYEMRYGPTVEVSLDTLLQMPEQYHERAVRTRGPLEMNPGQGRMGYSLRGTFGGRLLLLPIPDIEYPFETEARTWLGKELEVTGALQMGQDAATGAQTVYMIVWGYLGPPDDRPGRRPDSALVPLEDLVTGPERHDGRTVTVRGQFRGANLFGDLPSASRQRSSDWVLKDDLFAVWVTGKRARGSGWTLDPGLRRDTGKWLQVTGRVSVRGRVVTLQAIEVVLSTPPEAAPAARAEAPPPPPPPPRRPPVVVFSLPLDGERDVPPDGVFKVQFSQDMDEESFKGRVGLRYAGRPQPGDNALDAVKVTYDLGRRTLEIDPGDLLRPGRVVEVLLLPGIVDVDGQPLETRPGKSPLGAADVLRFQVAASGLLTGPLR
jgi:hypothetical protein